MTPTTRNLIFAALALGVGLMSVQACGSSCPDHQPTVFQQPDGGRTTCLCTGCSGPESCSRICGCFLVDGGECPGGVAQ